MSGLELNLLLAFTWVFLSGDFSFRSLTVGLVVGFLSIVFSQRLPAETRYVRAVLGAIRLFAVFARELLMANLQLARDVLRPTLPFTPMIVHVDVRGLGRTEAVLLSNIISLTPGSLTVDTADDGQSLEVHSLYAADPEAVRERVRRIATLIRGATGRDPLPPEGG